MRQLTTDPSLRFCVITTFYPHYTVGGDGIFVQRLSSELARRGHQVDVIHCVDSNLTAAGGDLRDVGVLLTSTDAAAVDVVAASMVGMAPLELPTIAAAVCGGLVTGRVGDIQQPGSPLEQVRVPGFKQPGTAERRVRMIPS